MSKAIRFGKRMMLLLLSCAAVFLLAMPAAAEMTDLNTQMVDRQFAVIHSGASTGSLVIGNLEDGTELTVVKEYTNFYRIDCYGMSGYIAKSQVKIDDNGHYYVNCDTDSAEMVTLNCKTPEGVSSLLRRAQIVAEAQLGVPYVYGGTSPRGFDCSGLVQYVYSQLGYDLTRTAVTQLSDGMIVNPDNLIAGDLVFFEGTYDAGAITSHVGIYIGDGQFIHAANNGVICSSLDEEYWAESFLCARRVILTGVMAYGTVTANEDSNSSGQSDRSFSLCYE